MRNIEKHAGKIIKRQRIQDGLLTALYTSGGLILAISAPNAAHLLKKIDPDVQKKRTPSARINQAYARLEKKELVRRQKENGRVTHVTLTKKGEKQAQRLFEKGKVAEQVHKKWDGRWRIVIFDIWEKRRATRDQLRQMLLNIGFVKVQNSVWIYPYNCEDLLILMRTDLRLGKSLLYFVAEGVENDAWLRKHFNLPPQ